MGSFVAIVTLNLYSNPYEFKGRTGTLVTGTIKNLRVCVLKYREDVTIQYPSPPAAARSVVWVVRLAAPGRQPHHPHRTTCEAPKALRSQAKSF